MKKFLFIIVVIFATFASSLMLGHWHIQEQIDRGKWREQSLAIIDVQKRKEAKLGRKLTEKEDSIFTDSIRTAWNYFPPRKCPYCYIHGLIKSYYGKEK